MHAFSPWNICLRYFTCVFIQRTPLTHAISKRPQASLDDSDWCYRQMPGVDSNCLQTRNSTESHNLRNGCRSRTRTDDLLDVNEMRSPAALFDNCDFGWGYVSRTHTAGIKNRIATATSQSPMKCMLYWVSQRRTGQFNPHSIVCWGLFRSRRTTSAFSVEMREDSETS